MSCSSSVSLEIIRRIDRDSCDDFSASSPLTSLSSLDGESELSDQHRYNKLYSIEDIEAAQVPLPPKTRMLRLRDVTP